MEEALETVKVSDLANGKSCHVINNANANDDDDVDISIITSKDIYKLIVSFNEFIKALPVIGFNSGRYDLNLIKKHIVPYLLTTHVDDNNDHDNDNDDDKNDKTDGDRHVKNSMFVVMRNSNSMCLKTNTENFLDIMNYLAPGFSYDKFLKAYGCTLSKCFFTYEWVNSLSKLDCESLLPKEAFHS